MAGLTPQVAVPVASEDGPAGNPTGPPAPLLPGRWVWHVGVKGRAETAVLRVEAPLSSGLARAAACGDTPLRSVSLSGDSSSGRRS